MFDLSSKEITEGSIFRSLAILATPLVLQNIVQAGQLLIDLFWLGRLSGSAVAAVALDSALIQLLFGFVIFAPFIGTQVLVSQRVGKNDKDSAKQAAWTGLLSATLLAIAAGIIAYIGAKPSIELLLSISPQESSDTVISLAVRYLQVIAMGLPILALADIVEASYVGWGDSRVSMVMNVSAVVTNAILDPFLIFGYGPFPKFGIRGAALATVLGSGMGLLIGLSYSYRGRGYGYLTQPELVLARDEYRKLMDIGAPAAVQNIMRKLVNIVLVLVVFIAGGAAGLAAYLIGNRVARIAYTPGWGLRQAAQSIVGQNLGADNPMRAKRATWLGVGVAAGLLMAFSFIQWTASGLIVTLLAPDAGREIRNLTVEYIRILAYGYPAFGAFYLLRAGFDGASHTQITLVAVLIQYLVLRLSIAIIGGIVLSYGIWAVFWANPISNIIVAAGLGSYYHYATQNGMLDRASERTAGS